MKFILSLFCLISTSAFAAGPGEISKETNFNSMEASVQAVVQRSKTTSSSVQGRDVASFSKVDKTWSSQYDELMADESDFDYLKAAYELAP